MDMVLVKRDSSTRVSRYRLFMGGKMDKVREILEEIRPDVDFDEEKSLIDDKILDSFDIIAIVTSLNEAFCIDINVNDLIPENFNSMEAILDLVNKLTA